MRRPAAASIVLTCLAAVAVAAAPPIRVEVDAGGRLVIPAAAVKKLKLKRANGLVCVEFPAPPPAPHAPGRHADHDDHQPPDPPRIWSPLRKDGAIVVTPLRGVRTAAGTVPGKPGTRYVGREKKGALLLTPAR